MDDFSLQRKIFRHIIKHRPSFIEGMQYALASICNARHGNLWTPCKPHLPKLLEKTQANWIAWFDRLAQSHSMPKITELLWFEVPSDLNPAMTSVSAYDKLGPGSEDYGLNEPRTWPEDKRGNTLDAGLHFMAELDKLFALSGWSLDAQGENKDKLRPGVYAQSYAATALLVINGLPKAKSAIQQSKGERGLSVVIGWADGDFDVVGTLKEQRWQPMRKASPSRLPVNLEELDINSYSFKLRKYLDAELDPNVRNSDGEPLINAIFDVNPKTIALLKAAHADFRAVDKDGRSVLHAHWTSEMATIRALVAAGANPNATTKNGEPVLFAYASREWSVVKVLIDCGANPRTKHGKGTFLDACIGYADIPVSGLHELWRRGVRFGKDASAIASIASTGFVMFPSRKAIKERVRFCLSKGQDMERPSRRTPLWVSLVDHADEIMREAPTIKKHIKEYGRVLGSWDYKRDDMAIVLLEQGANPNARYKPGFAPLIPKNATPLMVQRYDDAKLVKALLKHGADPTLKSAEGKTALDYAKAAQKKKHLLANVGVDEVVTALEKATQQWARGQSSRGLAKNSRKKKRSTRTAR